jgi:hypothetical protein
VLAVDEQRPGEADRDLGDAGELLDVAGQDGGIERVRADFAPVCVSANSRRLRAASWV